MAESDPKAPALWATRDMNGAYVEKDHPADMWLEVYGRDLPTLFEHGLYALYSHVVELDDVLPLRAWRLDAWGADVADALRALLAEALYRFDAEALVGAGARVAVRSDPDGGVEVKATVWGEPFDPQRQAPLAEIKAVTYHRLSAEQDPERGWRASVLFDV